jgi:O-antigen ligase
MNLAISQASVAPRPFEVNRVDAILAGVSAFAYVASAVKFLNRDPLSTDTGAQAVVEVALMALALIAAAVPTLRRGAVFPRPTPPVIGFSVFAALTMLSSPFSYWMALSLVKSFLLLGAVATAILLCTWRSPRDILGNFYWSSLVIMVIGLSLKFVSPEPLFEIGESGRQRLSILALHPNALADLAAMTLLIGRLLPRRPHWICQLLLLSIVAVTGARATGIILILVLAVSALWQVRRNAIVVSVLGVGIASVAFAGWMVVALQVSLDHLPLGGMLERFYGDYSSDEVATLNGRTEVWSQSANLVADTSVVGYGLDGARALFMDEFAWAGHSHNAYIELLLASGVPGLVVFLWAWGTAIVMTLKANVTDRALILSVHSYIFLCGFTDPNLTALQCLPLFLIVCLDAVVRCELIQLIRQPQRIPEFG